MQGYQITFFTQQDRKKGSLSLGDWLVQTARTLGISGATLTAGREGFGHDKKLHSAHFFDLADQPIEVTMILNEADVEKFFQHLAQEKINIFYVKTPIEFGMTDNQ